MSSSIIGIAGMTKEYEPNGSVKKIGQVAMLNNCKWSTHQLLRLCAIQRSGADMGHFHLQYRIGFRIFELSGFRNTQYIR